jgi:hypothetical protein
MQNGSTLRAVVLLLTVLAAGAAIGWFAHDKVRDARRANRYNSERVVKRLTNELNLDAAQQKAVLAILDNRRVDIDSLSVDVYPRFDAIRRLANAQIDSVLTPEQSAKFREDVRERDERRAERRKRYSGRGL